MIIVLPKIIAVLTIVVMPFMAPLFVRETGFNADPEYVKMVWGVLGMSAYLIAWLYEGINKSSLNITKSNFYLPIALFVIWSFLSVLWSINEYFAAISLFQISSYALIFFIVVNSFTKFYDSSRLLKYLVTSMALVSVVGLIQYYFPENSLIQSVYHSVALPGASFGNKNMASHFMVMTVPLSFMLMLSARSSGGVIFYSLISFVGSWFLIYTTARQAYVAVALQLLVLLVFFILDFWKNRERSLLKVTPMRGDKSIAVIVILLLLVLVSNLTNKGWSDGSGAKLEKLQEINLDAGSSRINSWMNSIEIIKDHPIAGVGPGQWQNLYPQYYDRVRKDVIFNEKIRLKKLHNDYIEMFVNVGLVGYVFLLWITYMLIHRIWKVLADQNSRHRYQVLGLALGLLGFATVAMFSFPIRVYLPAFLVMVYIALIDVASVESIKNSVLTTSKKYLVSLMMLLVVATYYLNKESLSWLISNAYRNNSNIFLMAGNLKELEFSSMQSLRFNPWNKDSYIHAGMSKFGLGKVKESIPFFKMSLNIAPFDTLALLNLSLSYMKVGDFDMAQKTLEFVVKIDPKNVAAFSYLVPILLQKGLPGEAKISYLRMKENFEYFKSRRNFGPYHKLALSTAIGFKDLDYINYVYQDSVDRGYIDSEIYLFLAKLEFHILSRKNVAVKWYKKALKIDPEVKLDKFIQPIADYESSKND